jgi:hypothetical protein
MLTRKLQLNMTIYNLPISFVQSPEALSTRYLKSVLGLPPLSQTLLCNDRKIVIHFGLSLKQLTDMFKSLQVSKAHMLKTSADPKIREVYKHRKNTHKDKCRWHYCIASLVRGFWDEKFSTRKSRSTEGPRCSSREGHNKSPLTYQ